MYIFIFVKLCDGNHTVLFFFFCLLKFKSFSISPMSAVNF